MKIIELALGLALILFGNRVVSQWVATIQLFWDKLKNIQLKKMADEEYNRLSAQWDEYKKDRDLDT